MPTVSGARETRSATGATIETSGAERGDAGRNMLGDGRERGSTGSQMRSAHSLPAVPAPDSVRLPGRGVGNLRVGQSPESETLNSGAPAMKRAALSNWRALVREKRRC